MSNPITGKSVMHGSRLLVVCSALSPKSQQRCPNLLNVDYKYYKCSVIYTTFVVSISGINLLQFRDFLADILKLPVIFFLNLSEMLRVMRFQVAVHLYPVWSKNPNACFLQRLQTCHRLLNVLISSLLSPIFTRPRAPKDCGQMPMNWKILLAYITGSVDQALLLRIEYLVTENRILRNQIKGHVRLRDGERKTLAEIGKTLGKNALQEVAHLVKPETILAWHRQLVAQKFDDSQQRKAHGRPKIDAELEALMVGMARENRSWGYDRIVGALANLGCTVSDQTVANILTRHSMAPAPERKTTTTWKEFIRTYMDVLVATDFFTAEVWTTAGLITYYVRLFIHLVRRKVHVAGVTPHPDARGMVQIARNVTMEQWGVLAPGQYLIHDRDGKYCPAFQQLIDTAGVKRVPLPPRSPNLNAYNDVVGHQAMPRRHFHDENRPSLPGLPSAASETVASSSQRGVVAVQDRGGGDAGCCAR
jgi:putative transposase